MRKVVVLIIVMFAFLSGYSQIRNGWRSIYDTSGRLARMSYYQNGEVVTDSNYFFQYFVDNVLKGIIRGEITQGEGCYNGSVYLLNEAGNLSSYSIKSMGQVIFSTTCDPTGDCANTWIDQFDADSRCWEYDSASFESGEMIIHNQKEISTAIYNPPVEIDINNPFVYVVHIPKKRNTVKQGVVVGWKDPENYYLIEISQSEYFSILYYKNGEYFPITDGRKPFQKKQDDINEIKISSNGKSLIFEINQKIETVIPLPEFQGNQIGLVARSKGNARFSDILFKYPMKPDSEFYTDKWLGKCTGFFISTNGKILTTYDAIADAKSIRVKGEIKGQKFVLPAKLVRAEEDINLAVLQVEDSLFKAFSELPFGYKETKSVSEANAFSVGYPNATAGILTKPEIFYGKVLPNSSSSSANDRVLEMSFRFGMIGSPVFDMDANLIGIVAGKGVDLKYSEVIEFSQHIRLMSGHMGKFTRIYESPYKELKKNEKAAKLSEITVIIESSVFDLENKANQSEIISPEDDGIISGDEEMPSDEIDSESEDAIEEPSEEEGVIEE